MSDENPDPKPREKTRLTHAQLERRQMKQMKQLIRMTAEYLTDFAIHGYDYSGNRVVLRIARSPQGYDAVCELLNRDAL
jgi:hypothetical protein